LRTHALGRKDLEIKRKRKVLEAKIASLTEEFESVQDELNKSYIEEDLKKEVMEKNRKQLMENRHTKNAGNGKGR
jgi:circadian clock protein KaiC